MNVYNCTYNGNLGYGCRLGAARWMFVPELAQVDSRIYKNVALHELSFQNPLQQRYEQQRAIRAQDSGFRHWVKSLLLLDSGPQTIGGRLFMVH